ncbi:L-valine transporter subunit YgaH [Martelella alba]|uniref:L-valine transporter subunit YgaH n=1 Tax=Martelella alba TaxID=2590451 RepID=A0ABY2SKG8_9HYPH|nr:L-valine transporter subunit YgaH [Martelella alba]TKI05292.1 L-valine transporter subunit YgaH [Martelella alba]
MHHKVIAAGLIVGAVNYLFRYMPLRLGQGFSNKENHAGRWVGRVLDGIGIASICALLVVSAVPEITRDTHRLIPTLVGFAVLIAVFHKTRSIVLSTLIGALGFGVMYKLLLF